MSYYSSLVKMQDLRQKINTINDRLEKEKNSIETEPEDVYIVNAGNMNHGKSSLLNSLLDKEVFKAADVRTTVKAEKQEYRKNVFVVDTPGLSAAEEDDKTASEAYRNASVIVFVHSIRTGELHQEETQWIKKMKTQMGSAYFKDHFCLVLTFKDENILNQDGGLDVIAGKIKGDLQQECGLSGFPLFMVSNRVYQEGIQKNKPKLVEISGFDEFKTYVDGQIPFWQKTLDDRKKKKFQNAKQKALRQLKKMEEEAREEKEQAARAADYKAARLNTALTEIEEELARARDTVDKLEKQYDKAKQEKDEAMDPLRHFFGR